MANDVAAKGAEGYGTVVRSTGSWYDVFADGRVIPCRIRGRFRLSAVDTTNPVSVGDRVQFSEVGDGSGTIDSILPRKNKLVRRAAGRRVGVEHVIVANIDIAFVVQSVKKPRFNPGFADRFLVMAAVHDVPPAIVVNKMDLLSDEEREDLEEWKDVYTSIGYPVVLTSVVTREGIDELAEMVVGRTAVFAGQSGVGKSSLLNAIDPSLDLKTGRVSERTRKGKHVTTHATLLPLSSGGFVVDTPGLREFGIVDLAPEELSAYFPDFEPYAADCRYPNCTHDHEPDCAVIDAVESGDVAAERWASYLSILESLRLGDKDVGR